MTVSTAKIYLAQHADSTNNTQHCLICKRKLTNPKSIERRMGDICNKKYLADYKGIQAEIKV